MLKFARAAFDIAATLVMLVAGSALLWRMYSDRGPSARPSTEDLREVTLAAERISNARGDSRLVLIEFGDYECPFCSRHHEGPGQMITERFVKTGLLQHAFLNFPLDIHPRAAKAAEAAECAARQGKFWEMHESLFTDATKLGLTDLLQHARDIGLNETQFNACVDNQETASLVRRDLEEGRRLGVTGTPAFFLGLRRADGTIDLMKRLDGALEFAEFEKAIRAFAPKDRAQL